MNSYNLALRSYSLPTITSFTGLTSDVELQAQLASVYGDVDNVDMFVGIISEDHLPGSSLGRLGSAIMALQFRRLRDGDRFFFTGDTDLQEPPVASDSAFHQGTVGAIID